MTPTELGRHANRVRWGGPAEKEARFWARVDRSGGVDACWPWTASIHGNGYGWTGAQPAHREAYKRSIGPIPRGLALDHLCRNRICCNPRHLEAVTDAENNRRAAQHRRATHPLCPLGHPYSVVVRPSESRRLCRVCTRRRHTAFMRTYRPRKVA